VDPGGDDNGSIPGIEEYRWKHLVVLHEGVPLRTQVVAASGAFPGVAGWKE